MKKLLVSFGAAITTLICVAGSAAAGSYQNAYCYPTGSYWIAQRAAYPDYYAANNAYYTAQYGLGTYYCN